MTWIKDNVAVLIVIVGIFAGWVATWTKMSIEAEAAAGFRSQMAVHIMDTSIHVDPQRDERRWQELLMRLTRIENKIDGR